MGVLWLVDGERKPAMGYIYEAMNRAKEDIARSFGGNESKYEDIFKLIDARWSIQLHRPLYGVGWFLNLEFFYNTRNVDDEVANGLYTCRESLVPNVETQCAIDLELSKYKKAEGLFGNPMGVRMRGKKSPTEWWDSYGTSTPALQKFAIKILSLTCSSSGCERMAGTSKDSQKGSKDISQSSSGKKINIGSYSINFFPGVPFQPLAQLKDKITEAQQAILKNIWFFRNDNKAAGVGEPSYRFRAREASSSWVPQVRPMNQLLDKEESEEEIEGQDEGKRFQQEEL
ncbi:hypothetical protein Ddye_030198 [Dipteronia dyeriana]|uniref:HAT C-terminal dimerisation domain-containing protein n=1 Tax=Dipteronia dyeriana TaxID=168575 RepID=A0AAD9TGN4_9ROSI|nr:hypothetical protein Ddye_030198 [Dipteronia dyeriana]